MEIRDTLNPSEQTQLIGRLRSLTDARKLTWKPLDNRKDGCFTSVGDTRYEVSSVDDDGVSPFQLLVFTGKGSRLTASIVTKPTLNPETEQINQDLQQLFITANRNARGGQGVIEDLFADLDTLERGEEEG